MLLYETLKIPKKASQSQIHSSYKRLAKKYHPDIYKHDTSTFIKINYAYSILKNKKKRSLYNIYGRSILKYLNTPSTFELLYLLLKKRNIIIYISTLSTILLNILLLPLFLILVNLQIIEKYLFIFLPILLSFTVLLLPYIEILKYFKQCSEGSEGVNTNTSTYTTSNPYTNTYTTSNPYTNTYTTSNPYTNTYTSNTHTSTYTNPYTPYVLYLHLLFSYALLFITYVFYLDSYISGWLCVMVLLIKEIYFLVIKGVGSSSNNTHTTILASISLSVIRMVLFICLLTPFIFTWLKCLIPFIYIMVLFILRKVGLAVVIGCYSVMSLYFISLGFILYEKYVWYGFVPVSVIYVVVVMGIGVIIKGRCKGKCKGGRRGNCMLVYKKDKGVEEV